MEKSWLFAGAVPNFSACSSFDYEQTAFYELFSYINLILHKNAIRRYVEYIYSINNDHNGIIYKGNEITSCRLLTFQSEWFNGEITELREK